MKGENADHPVPATAGQFTNDAVTFAVGKPIERLYGDRPRSMIKEVKQASTARAAHGTQQVVVQTASGDSDTISPESRR